MVIDWTAAPEGTTHATIPNGDPRWYKLEGGKVLCWATRLNEWAPSFFLTADEISDTGLRLYANGEQSELVMLREQRDALVDILKVSKVALESCCNTDNPPKSMDYVKIVISLAGDAISNVEGHANG